jgi:hypothetical protein
VKPLSARAIPARRPTSMRRLVLPALLFLAAGRVLAVEPIMPAHVVAESFCVARIIGDMSLAEAYFSEELSYAIDKAMAQNAVIQKQHPDEKPPLGDGVPWGTYPDAVPECVVDYDAATATPAEIPVTYRYPEAPDANWTDKLVLRQVDGEWKLDDVLYQDGGKLTEFLVSAFAQ